MSDIVIKRKLGGLDISATVSDTAAYRGRRKEIDARIDQAMAPYNSRNERMTRHDAAMVCGPLSLQLKDFGVTVLRPFTVDAVAQASQLS